MTYFWRNHAPIHYWVGGVRRPCVLAVSDTGAISWCDYDTCELYPHIGGVSTPRVIEPQWTRISDMPLMVDDGQ